MKKGYFQDNIDKIVRLIPRPKKNGKLIAKPQNFWLILGEYGEGIVVLNKITNHEGRIPYDSMREWREPDMVILSAQVNVGKDGLFEISPFIDGPETEMLIEGEEFLPERLAFVKNRLAELTENEIKVLTQLVIQDRMTTSEIQIFCRSIGISGGYEIDTFFIQLMQNTQMIEKDDPHRMAFTAWIKPGFVSILEKLLLHSQRSKGTMVPQPASPSATESHNS